jgi:hypothetical protein
MLTVRKAASRTAPDAGSPDQNLNQSGARVPQPAKIPADLIRRFVSDPDYPSYEILLRVAGKLLDAPR